MPRKKRKAGLAKRRVLLLCTQSLLGDGLRAILGGLEDVELIGPLILDARALERVAEHQPDVMLVAEDGDEDASAASLTARLLERYPDVPVIHVGLRQDTIRLHTSRTLPARSTDLIEAIRRLPALVGLVTRREESGSRSKS